MNITNPSSKRVHEEIKKKQDEKATADLYQEFISSFDEKGKIGKTFVRGEIVNAQPDKINVSASAKTGQIYKPTSKFMETTSLKMEKLEKVVAPKKKDKEKKKSNLELFKEELQRIQEEREERNRLKQELRESMTKGGKVDPIIESWLSKDKEDDYYAHLMSAGAASNEIWENDPNTTNIFLANVNPKVNEEMLCDMFGEFGPLASVKIMWPRSDEEISRNKNCGFVAYMNRKDGERALKKLQGVDLMGYDMKLGWGKPVPIPPHPIYIPPHLIELTLPPPPSGLPFNAQVPKISTPRHKHRRDSKADSYDDDSNHNSADEDVEMIDGEDVFTPVAGFPIPPADPVQREKFEKTLRKSTVRVVVPTERPLLSLIHRMVEFVVREGPRFEAMIMNRELKNPMFRFLFDNKSPAHVYYRWKLFSILNGDTPTEWSTKKFRLFKGGSYWQPPPLNLFALPSTAALSAKFNLTQPVTLASDLGADSKGDFKNVKKHIDDDDAFEAKELLSQRQRDRLESMLRKLTRERDTISDAMIFCVDHAEAASEIVECLCQSLAIPRTPLIKKLARIYLISDILYNCSCKAPNVSYFRKSFQRKLPLIFKEINKTFKDIKSKAVSEQFRQRIINCLKSWEEWELYPSDYIIKLQCIFLGLESTANASNSATFYQKYQEPLLNLINNGQNSFAIQDTQSPLAGIFTDTSINFDHQIYDDIDGAPLQLNFEKNASFSIFDDDIYPQQEQKKQIIVEDDIDGMPLPQENIFDSKPSGSFIKSKWEEVDEMTLQTQVMTTSKWDTLEESENNYYDKILQNSPVLSEPPDGNNDENNATSPLLFPPTNPNPTLTASRHKNEAKNSSSSSAAATSKESSRRKTSSKQPPPTQSNSATSTTSKTKSSSTSTVLPKKVVDYEDDDEDGDEIAIVLAPHSTSRKKNKQQHSTPSHDNLGEDKRLKLREIELKVVKFQDDLENGKVSKKSGMTILEQVQRYRTKLIDQEKVNEDKKSSTKKHEQDKGAKFETPRRRRSPSPSSSHNKSKKSKHEYSSRREESRKNESSSATKKHHKSK